MAPRRILMIGAGAVGQAYGFHLRRAGHHVTFLVRSRYVDALNSGLDVHCLRGAAKGSHRFTDFSCQTLESLPQEHWDQVWLCMSSTALRGEWFELLVSRIEFTTFVMLQPGLFDREYILKYVAADRLVRGMIGLVSFMAPLPGSTRSPGMTWWFPPLGPTLFSGPNSSVSVVVQDLNDGGCPAKRVDDVSTFGAFGSALLMPLVAALEVADWSLTTLRQGAALKLAAASARQATQLACPGRRRWLVGLITNPLVLKMIIAIAPRVTPFDLQGMLKSHFTKVGAQTRAMLETYLTLASERQEPSDGIEALSRSLPPQSHGS